MSRVARSDDERALSELYDRYGGLIYSVGMRYLGDRTLAEDLVQDVFLSVWRNAAGFDRSRASFATGVYRRTRDRITDLAHRPRARVRIVAPVPEEAFPDPGDGTSPGVLRAETKSTGCARPTSGSPASPSPSPPRLQT
jgi:RNA polymerase sigma factor (sigma-70 family)